MEHSLFVTTLPIPKGQWTKETQDALQQLCAELATALAGGGAVRLTGDHTPIARISYDGRVVTAEGIEGGALRIHVIGTLQQALVCAMAPIVANQFFLALGTTHVCVVRHAGITVLVDGAPYAELTLVTEGAQLSSLGIMPPWTFTVAGKPSKMEAYDGWNIATQILKRLKKDEPRFVLRDDTTGEWYAQYMVRADATTVLTWTGAPQKAYSWVRESDALVHAMALEGLYAIGWTTAPTAPGWEQAAKWTADTTMTVHTPVAPLAFSIHRHDPRHGGTQEVVSAERFRALATARRHQERVGVVPYGGLACEVLAHVAQDAAGVDRFVAVCDPSHTAPVRETLAALGVATRANPCVRLAQKKGYHDHLPTVWSLALSGPVADALVQQAASWPGVVVADHLWKDMWP